VPQSGSADATGQGKRLKLVPLSLDVQSLKDSVRPAPDLQRNAIRLPSGDQVPLSAPVFSRSSRRPCPLGWMVARVAFLGERELAGHESNPFNNNDSEFCNRRIEAKAHRARLLGLTNPPAANRAWERVYRDIINQAPWLPTVTPTWTDFISKRAGNYQFHPLWGILIDQLWVR